MKYDAVIIGSGVTGLTAALVLAQNDKRVALVEKHHSIAPLLQRFKRGNSWFDVGFHYSGGFEQSGSLSILFRYLRMRDSMRSIPMNNDGFDIIHMYGKQMAIPCGMDRVRDALCDYFPGSKKAVHSYIEKINLTMNVTPFINYDIKFENFNKNNYYNGSLAAFMDESGAEEDLKKMIGQYGEYLYGVSCDEVPFAVHAMVMGSFYRSAQTLSNGGDGIVEAFEKRLRQEGVDVFCGSPAVSIEVDDKQALKGVKTGKGDFLECDTCIATIHPMLLLDILPSSAVRPAYISRIKGLENTGAPFTVYLEADNIPERLTYSNLYKMRDHETQIALGIMACDPVEYDGKKKGLSVMKGAHVSQFPEGFYGTGKRSTEYLEYKQIETENIVQQIMDFYPELRGRCKVVDSATPFTYERYTGTWGGSMYGVKQSVSQIKLNQMTSIKNLYLAGQSILMPGVISCIVSGFLAASNIIGLETLWNEVRKWR